MSPEDEKACEKLLGDSRKFFTCPVLRIRMRKLECLTRHRRQPKLSTGGRIRILLYNEPADHYCRGKECETGFKIRRQLKGK